MKLVSWNVNGIRAALKKGFLDFVSKEKPAIICLQEIKAHENHLDGQLNDYFQYWNGAEKKGYAGTAILTKIKPLNVVYGLGLKEHDSEGRVITAEFSQFYLVNVYTPNSQHGLLRLKYRRKWNTDFLNFVLKLNEKKPVVFCGDLNVAHNSIDLTNPGPNRLNPGFTDEERADFTDLLNEGFVDSFRYLHPEEKNRYSWWSYRFNARKRNIGWRIDYFGVAEKLKQKIKCAGILENVLGSDHCPVLLELTLD